METYYVYVYRDPRPHRLGRPFYVGKGTDKRSSGCRKRAWIHWTTRCTNALLALELRKIDAMGLKPIVETVATFHDEDAAFDEEERLILEYGRRDKGTGPLCNRTSGKQGANGYQYEPKRLAAVRAHWATPEMKQLASDRAKASWRDPDIRRRIKESLAQTQQCPEYRKRLREAIKASRTPEIRAIIGEASRARWQDPEYQQKWARAQKEALMRPEERARKSEATKKAWAENHEKMRAAITEAKRKPEHRAAVGARSKAYYENNKAARLLAGEYARAYNTPEVRAQKAEIMRQRWQDPEYRRKMAERRAARKAAKEAAALSQASEPPSP